MRIRRLELRNYGPFDHLVLDFAERGPDLHLVYGPNEAGKSTVLQAVVDLVCGIRRRRPYPFPHDHPDTCLVAELAKGDRIVTFRRSRGNMEPLPEDVWPHGSVDRAVFERLFGLDHERLRAGGRDLLAAGGEIGRVLLGATTGLEGLDELRTALRREAEELWIPAPAGRRCIHELQARLEKLEKQRADLEVRGSDWERRRRTLAETEEQYRELHHRLGRLDAERRRLERIRRVHPLLGHARELRQALEAIGEVPPLPENAGEMLAGAERRLLETAGELEALAPGIRDLETRIETLRIDEALLARAAEIEDLDLRRGAVNKALQDLPRRRDELAREEARRRELLAELGWPGDPETARQRLPSLPVIRRVRELVRRHAELTSRMEGLESAVEQARERLAELEARRVDPPEMPDVAPLAAAIAAVERAGDLAERIRTACLRASEIRSELGRILVAMERQLDGASTLETRLREADGRATSTLLAEAIRHLEEQRVPTRNAVDVHRERRRRLEQHEDSLRTRRDEIMRELARLRTERDRFARREGPVPDEELARARGHRDHGWRLIRRHYVEGEPLDAGEVTRFAGADGDLVAAYERAVREADALADRRFERAHAVARLAEMDRTLAAREAERAEVERQLERLAAEREQLEERWRALWADLGRPPQAPDVMLGWLERRERALELSRQWQQARMERRSLREREAQLRDELRAGLAATGFVVPETQADSLAALLAHARLRLRELENQRSETERLARDLAVARRELERRERDLAQAHAELRRWEDAWRRALEAVCLATDTPPEAVEGWLQRLEELRAVVGRIDELRERRILPMERDLREFEAAARSLVGELAPDLVEREPLVAVAELRRRLEETRRHRELRRQLEADLTRLRRRHDEVRKAQRQAAAVIERLREEAGVEDEQALRALLERAKRRRELVVELQRAERSLRTAAEGRTVEELEAECRDVDADTLPAEIERLERELADLGARLRDLHARREQARRELEAVGGDDAVARLRAEREEVVAACREVAARYVRLRAALLLLERAEARLRERRPPDFLRRCGDIFRRLTGGSFVGIEAASGERDVIRIVGVRPDGRTVPPEAMSDGTVDQLHLALRIAAVEERVRGRPLPFVADDLLVNFDDARAAAALHVLAELARSTQVLLFTHHRHLVELAEETLGRALPAGAPPVITLPAA